MADEQHGDTRNFSGSRYRIVFLGFLAIGAFFLVTEHWAHIIPVLPWLLLAACPLMHFFMHGGHGGQGHEHRPASGAESPVPKPNPNTAEDHHAR